VFFVRAFMVASLFRIGFPMEGPAPGGPLFERVSGSENRDEIRPPLRGECVIVVRAFIVASLNGRRGGRPSREGYVMPRRFRARAGPFDLVSR
jgi:hypothetical protein